MKKYFAVFIVFLLIGVSIHISQNGATSETEMNTLASLLDSSPSDLLSADLQRGSRTVANQDPKNATRADASVEPAPAVTRAKTPVVVSRQPKSTAPVPAQAPAASYKGSSPQTEMLAYINTARAQAHLAPLVLSSKLSNGAYLKSQDMAVEEYFSHYSPTYGSMTEMMKTLGIAYRAAGENIAKHGSVQGAHEAFMNSAEHRANITNAAFKQVGLGFYQRGNYLYVTQWFTN